MDNLEEMEIDLVIARLDKILSFSPFEDLSKEIGESQSFVEHIVHSLEVHLQWVFEVAPRCTGENSTRVRNTKNFLKKQIQQWKEYHETNRSLIPNNSVSNPILIKIPNHHWQYIFLNMLKEGVVLNQFLCNQQLCDNDQLATYLIFILQFLIQYVPQQKTEVIEILRKRLFSSHMLRMQAFWLFKCRLLNQNNIRSELMCDETEYKGCTDAQKFFISFMENKNKYISQCQSNNKWNPLVISTSISDPLFGQPFSISAIKLLKVFDSKSKPILMSLTYSPNENDRYGYVPNDDDYKMLFKDNDDVELDFLVLKMFALFNQLWKTSTMNIIPEAFIYNITPIASKTALVEFVSPSIPVRTFQWAKLVKLSKEDQEEFIATAVGAFVASFVLGIADRHQDNMMIQDGKRFLHIDFGWCFGAHPPMDADLVAIPISMQTQLKSMNLWETFTVTAVDALSVLRRNSNLIIFLATTVFDCILLRSTVESWLHSTLCTPISESQARVAFSNLVQSSGSSWYTWIKNYVHEIKHPN